MNYGHDAIGVAIGCSLSQSPRGERKEAKVNIRDWHINFLESQQVYAITQMGGNDAHDVSRFLKIVCSAYKIRNDRARRG